MAISIGGLWPQFTDLEAGILALQSNLIMITEQIFVFRVEYEE